MTAEPSSKNSGSATEDVVERLCKVAFLSDFVIRSPKVTKGKGCQKEVADFLVPFGDQVLGFQVKRKTKLGAPADLSECELGRIERTIADAVGQLNTTRRSLQRGALTGALNMKGHQVPVTAGESANITGIVILHLVGQEDVPPDEKLNLHGGFSFQNGMPIHMFMLEDFEHLVGEVDTLPDFLAYLEMRKALFMKGVLIPSPRELDLLTVYKTNRQCLEDCLADKVDGLFLQEGIWEEYRESWKERIRERDALNSPAYLVDRTIEYMHTAIGVDLGLRNPSDRNDFEPGSLEGYWATIKELSQWDRMQRRVIGERLLAKMRKADGAEYGYGFAQAGIDEGCLVFSTSEGRQSRADRLYFLCSVAYCGMGLKKVVGIATEPLSARARSFDVLILKEVKFENHEELAALMPKFFGKATRNRSYEYPALGTNGVVRVS